MHTAGNKTWPRWISDDYQRLCYRGDIEWTLRSRAAYRIVTETCGFSNAGSCGHNAMSEIIPRWEWRSFGPRFGEAEKRLAALTPSGVQESDEVYLLSGAGGNVKIRAALMDIKVLRQVNADGLEQWTPVMKAGFPIGATDAARVFEALQLPVPSLSREGLHARRVHRRRSPRRAGRFAR